MNTVKDIIAYLEAEREEAFVRHEYWKKISPSEASKHIIRATTIESILDYICPNFESEDTEK